MTAATMAPTRVNLDLLAQNVTAFMLGSSQPTKAFGEALNQMGYSRTPDGTDVDELTVELGREIGWHAMIGRAAGRPHATLLNIVGKVLGRHF